jgi:hypothetical protein
MVHLVVDVDRIGCGEFENDDVGHRCPQVVVQVRKLPGG